MTQLQNGSVWPWRQRKKEEQKSNGFNLDLIWIEIGVFKNNFFSRNELASPIMGTIVLVIQQAK